MRIPLLPKVSPPLLDLRIWNARSSFGLTEACACFNKQINNLFIYSMKPKENLATIYEAALSVFADYGYKKATLDDIAAALGMTKGNLYRYARNKKDLYHNTVRHALLRWQGRVREAISREPDVVGQFHVMCRKAVAYLSRDDALRRLLVRDPDIFPMFPADDPYADINANSVAMIRSIVERGIAEERFRPVDLDTVPEIIFSVYKMFIIRMYIKSQDRAQEEMFTQTVALMTRGLFIEENA
jgi:AcrR family transcriptional regulator